MQCPVCNHSENPEGAEHCSSCGSDLQAYHSIERVQIQRRNYRVASLILGVLAISITSYFVWAYVLAEQQDPTPSAETTTMAVASDAAKASSDQQFEELEVLLQERDNQIATLKEEISQLEATMQSSHDDVKSKDKTIHIVKEGESLWSISEMYHGHGWEHASIAGHNDVSNIHHIEIGDTIIIKH